jgi:hypothetical protein
LESNFKLIADVNLAGVHFYAISISNRTSGYVGVFDGNGHTISNLAYDSNGVDNIGLFGYVRGGTIKALGLIDPNIDAGTGNGVGSLVGYLAQGSVADCYASGGAVSGNSSVGGLVGRNGGTVTQCYSAGAVSGSGQYVGGLVGCNGGSLAYCYSTGVVSGTSEVGGLVGWIWWGTVTHCYSTGAVNGSRNVGGLAYCYSTGVVTGDTDVGGSVGSDSGGTVTQCFWDIQTSGQTTSAGGTGKTTAQMQMASTFLGWGACGPLWTIDEGKDYPHLAWEEVAGQIIAGPAYGGGTGTADAPYLVYTAEHLNSIGLALSHWDKQFKLMADIDLSGFDGKDGRPAFQIIAPGKEQYSDYGSYPQGVPFTGVFDGNGHAILNFTYTSTDTANAYIGLFGYVDDPNAQIKDLGLIDPNVTRGSVPSEIGGGVGCLVGCLEHGTITGCYVQGGSVKGKYSVGGLVGSNGRCSQYMWFRDCWGGTISNSYTAVSVDGNDLVGGLVGSNGGTLTACFWDTQTSGQTTSAGGTGKTTAEMRKAKTFLDAGWDFVGEAANGTEDIWWILEGKDYPHLWWEAAKK